MPPAGADLIYVRGAPGRPLDLRRLAVVAALVACATLTAIASAMARSAVDRHDRWVKLRAQGVPVIATVTGCLGQVSGSGSTVSGYTCTATFTVQGQHHSAVIRGDTGPHRLGDTIGSLVLTNEPDTLTARTAVRSVDGLAPSLVPPALLVLAGVTVVGLALSSTRKASSPAARTDPLPLEPAHEPARAAAPAGLSSSVSA